MGEAELITMRGELLGRLRYTAAATLLMTAAVLSLIGAGALPLIGRTADSAMLVFAVSRGLPPLILHLRVPAATGVTKISVREGVSFGLATTFTNAYVTSDVLLLPLFGVAGFWIAIYGIAYKILTALQTIPASVATALYPQVALATRNGQDQGIRAPLGAGVAAAGMAVALLFLDLPFLFSFVGSSYKEGVDVVRPLLAMLLPITISMVCISGIQARDHEREVLHLVMVIAIMNVVGNIVLIPMIGVRGALIATSAAEWFAAFGAMLLAIQFCDLQRRDFGILVGAGAVYTLTFIVAIPGAVISALLVVWLTVAVSLNALGLRVSATELVRNVSTLGRASPKRPAPVDRGSA
jgi:O-antigen/teichoic acid export membrane protein